MAGAIDQVLRFEVTLNPAAASREHIMNVWHFGVVTGQDPQDTAEQATIDLSDFYQAIDENMSVELDNAVPHCRVFDLSDPKPRQPIYEADMDALNTSDSRCARELAICLSYRGVYVSGVTPKRKRGRIYLGPWSSGLVVTSTGKIDPTIKASVVAAGQALFDENELSTVASWVVYSPTTDVAGTGAPTAATLVTQAWVDDEVDVQRRRGMPQPGVKTFIS